MSEAKAPDAPDAGNSHNEPGSSATRSAYIPPFNRVLESLHLSEYDLTNSSVTIATKDLLRLMSELLRRTPVDDAYYKRRYPDVYSAVLAGDARSTEEHFQLAGYREGRHPREPEFDPEFYFNTYPDLASVFNRADVDGLQRHYETRGYYEGRAGVPEHFLEAERWRVGLPEAD